MSRDTAHPTAPGPDVATTSWAYAEAPRPSATRRRRSGPLVRAALTAALLAGLVTSLPATADAATLTSNAPACLASLDSFVTFTASGFAPNAAVEYRFRNEATGSEYIARPLATADAAGNATYTEYFTPPTHSIVDYTVTAGISLSGGFQPASNPVSVKVAGFGFTSSQVDLEVRPTASRTLTFTGLPAGEQVWAHLRLNTSEKKVTSVPIGVASDPCGTLTVADVKFFPFANPAPGLWFVQYDTSPTFSPANNSRDFTDSFQCYIRCRGGTVRSADQALPPPVQGRTVNAEPVKGVVRVKRPGQRTFTILKAGQQIPVGSTVDTTKGRMRLTSAAGGTKLNVAEFYEGQFRIAQAKGKSLTRLLLTGGDLAACPRPGSSAENATRKPKKRPGRRLWGSGSGDYQTGGRHSAATVRGTIWLVEDRCDGTLTRVRQGVVSVRDFPARRTVTVRAGKSYLARRP